MYLFELVRFLELVPQRFDLLLHGVYLGFFFGQQLFRLRQFLCSPHRERSRCGVSLVPLRPTGEQNTCAKVCVESHYAVDARTSLFSMDLELFLLIGSRFGQDLDPVLERRHIFLELERRRRSRAESFAR